MTIGTTAARTGSGADDFPRSWPLDDDTARRVLRLVESLEDLDDVADVWANFDVSDEVLESV